MSGWPTARLGDLVDFHYGKALPARSRMPGRVPVFGSNGVTGYHDVALINEPTIVVGRKGSVGAVHPAKEPCFPIDTTYYLRRKRPEQIDLDFLQVALQRLDLNRLKTATGVPGLNREDAYREHIPLPPLDEQRRIVDILNRANGILRLRREALDKTRQLIPALFVDMFGDREETGIASARFGDLLQLPLRNGVSPSKGGKWMANVLTLSAITGTAFDSDAVKQGAFAREASDLDRVDHRDFLICRGNGNLTLVGRAKFPIRPMHNVVFPDTAIAARVNNSVVDRVYLDAVWSSTIVRSQIERLAQTTSGTYKVNQSILSAIELPLPPLVHQHRFSSRVADTQATIAQQERMAAVGEQLVAALMARLFGDVPSDPADLPAAPG